MKAFIRIFLLFFSFLLFEQNSMAQAVVNVQWGEYVPNAPTAEGNFPGYGADHPDAVGAFWGAIGKTSGTVEAGTAIIVMTLAPEVPWDGSTITVPPGWELDLDNTTPTNIVFINTVDWTDADEEPFFEIPVRAIQPRTSTVLSVGTQVFNAGGSWVLHPDAPDKYTAIQVNDVNLPVVLTSFIASSESNHVTLTWSTTEETNSDRFEVERSATGKNWHKIGTVKAQGESNILRNYSLADVKPLSGTNYYRLKMIDRDATFTFSRIESTVFNSNIASVYPNPAVSYFKISRNENISSIKITDMTGREISPSKYELDSNNEVKVKAPLNTGIYLVSVKDANGLESVHKLIIGQ